MRTNLFLLAGSFVFLLFSACSSVKRFKSADYRGTDNDLVQVELFSSRLSPEPFSTKDKHLWNLSANAQTRLVQILDARYPDNGKFISALSRNYGEGEEGPGENFTRKDLQMVFTISKNREYSVINEPAGRFSPADRIEYLKLSLEIPEKNNLSFIQWNRFTTEYGELEIADVSFSRSLELDAGGEPRGVALRGRATLNRSEKQAIEERYLKLNGSLSAHQIVLEEEGTRETDLTGNISAHVSLEFEAFPERVVVPFFSDSGHLVLQFRDVLVPAMKWAPDTLYARLTLEYIYRHVQSAWNTYAEWDDQVEFYRGKVQKKVPLFARKDYLPGFYCIGSDLGDRERLKYQAQGKEYLLQFLDYRTALQFMDWLTLPDGDPSGPAAVGSFMLRLGGQAFTPAMIQDMDLKILPVFH